MSKNKPYILIVDDQVIFQELLHDLLKDKYKTRIAGGGIEALQILMQEPLPDLILLDWMMPDVDGLFVCQQVKNHPLTTKIPVLFLTAKDNIEDELKGFEVGAVDYIHKPISPPILLARVKLQLELRIAQQKLQQQKKELETLLEIRNEELEQSRILALSWFETLFLKNNNKKEIYLNSLKDHTEDYENSELLQLLTTTENLTEDEINDDLQDLQNEAILKQLEKILSSKQFSSAKKISSLLKFIVHETLDGCVKKIKAFTIAMEVFQRDTTFDPQQDPIIRVQAGNLRKRLENYYLTDGINDPIIIDIPKGGYSAVFSKRESIAPM